MKKRKILYIAGLLSFFLILWIFKFDIKKSIFDRIFLINDIEIIGYKILSSNDIENFFDEEMRKENLLFLNPWILQRKIISHPLTQNIEIKKQYPNKLSIYVEEKNPILLITDNKKNYILDKNGSITEIDQNLIKKYSEISSLLKMEGESILNESHEIARIFLNKNYTKRVIGLYKIGKRRWDMIVDYKIKVMLPEQISDDFVDYVFTTIDRLKVSYDIHQNAIYSIVDMRIKNRIFIKNIDE